LIGGASPVDICQVLPIREHDHRIAEPHWRRCDAFKTLSGRAGMLSSCPIGSVASWNAQGLGVLPRGRFQPRFREPFPTSRRRAGSTEPGAGANGASPLDTSGIPTTFARAPAAPIPCYPSSTEPSTSRRRSRDEGR
jgi:hypothetical protein